MPNWEAVRRWMMRRRISMRTPTPEQAERLAKIDASSGHLLSIINDVLDLSKIEVGKFDLEQSDFHLSTIFGHILSLLKDPAEKKGLKLVLDRNDVPFWLKGDPNRLRQALLNLVVNARQAMPMGGELIVRLRRDGSHAVLTITDTGVGMAPEDVERCFDAYWSTKKSGSGLGLATVHRVVENLQGTITLHSSPGAGVEFCVRIPGAADVGSGDPMERRPSRTSFA